MSEKIDNPPAFPSCHICANGNDISPLDGGECAACGRGAVPPAPPKPEQPRDLLAEAVRKARGGDAPIEVKGYA